PRAAVDEAVAQARRFGRASAAGFVNAVLRNATRNPDPTTVDPAVRWSHPPELLNRFIQLTDDPAQLQAFCRHNNSEPPTILLLAEGVAPESLAAPGISLIPHAEGHRLYVAQPAPRKALLAEWASRGVAQVQDPTAAGVVSKMDIQPGMTILDRCCGRGTKTLQMAAATGRGGRVFAMDCNAARCQALRQALAHRALDHVGVIEASRLVDASVVLPQQFDRVLVDAPCSNSGVLARRPEARYRQNDQALEELTRLQAFLLADSAPAVRPGGLLVYSTCSIWPEENDRQVEAFLRENREFELVESIRRLPHSEPDPTRYHDGGFTAVLRRRGPD
ncbi:MAG: RsmB/NOP family class I SAM-dependent RNA methyltransferase, partial [Phycisphaerae bacterium]|nr:RsmB/NOP family class I SAM-dependent RNA methyltransferase [Phycisphaerae bacterium]MDW8261449.1 RsmB/NOP family class I SAM-dependent RNA methyltransferase [Phycisphaerales bacterium]